MRLYSCKVRLGGSLYNEVLKSEVTAAEIHILRALHGNDAVIDVKEIGKNKISQPEERDRLTLEYGAGLAAARQLRELPDQAVIGVFGLGSRLPDDIPGAPKAGPKATPVAQPEIEDGPTDPEE